MKVFFVFQSADEAAGGYQLQGAFESFDEAVAAVRARGDSTYSVLTEPQEINELLPHELMDTIWYWPIQDVQTNQNGDELS